MGRRPFLALTTKYKRIAKLNMKRSNDSASVLPVPPIAQPIAWPSFGIIYDLLHHGFMGMAVDAAFPCYI